MFRMVVAAEFSFIEVRVGGQEKRTLDLGGVACGPATYGVPAARIGGGVAVD
jgi:hypothetical protein